MTLSYLEGESLSHMRSARPHLDCHCVFWDVYQHLAKRPSLDASSIDLGMVGKANFNNPFMLNFKKSCFFVNAVMGAIAGLMANA